MGLLIMEDQRTFLRPARPELEEGVLFASYLDMAAEGFFGFMLGRNAESIIASSFVELGHSLSYEHVRFVERKGEVVGMSLAYTGVQRLGFSDEPLRRAAGRSAFRMRIVRLLFAPLWRILETIPKGDFYLQGIAVKPGLRGAGIGTLLMDDIEGRAHSCGSSRISLDVGTRNKVAINFYKKHGMVEFSQWPNSRFLPTVFMRMTKDL